MTKNDLTAEYIRQLFDYDATTGALIWRQQHDNSVAWNSRYAGKPAGSIIPARGYVGITVNKTRYFAHRLVWLHQRGEWPLNQTDHINGVKHDNRIENLRDVTALVNGRNQRKHSTNTSGVTGVYRMRGKWRAYIHVAGERKHLGTYESIEHARAARIAADRIYGFHPNHGLTP